MIRIPESFNESSHRLTCTIPSPTIETERMGDGSFELRAVYDAREIADFPRIAANEMYEKFEAAIIGELLELNGYVKAPTKCEGCRHFRTTLTEHCDLHRHLCKGDDYCSWAEMKEES